MVAYLLKPEGSEDFHQIVDFLNTSHIKFALTENPTIYTSLIQQLWQTASSSTLEDGDVEITATIDGQLKTITEASLRRHLKLEDADGISSLPNSKIFEQLALMGVPTPPHDSPLPGGHTPGSDEGSMTLTELMILCTQFSTKVASLEQDLKQTKKIQEDTGIQGRTSVDTEILLDQEEPTELVRDLGSGEKGEKEISTANISVSTASSTPEFSTTAENLVYIRRSAEKRKDKGKAIMKDDESLQEEFDRARQEQEVVAEADQAHDIDWSDHVVLRYHAVQNRSFSKAEDSEIEKEVMKRPGFDFQQKSSKKRSRNDSDEDNAKKQKLEDDAEKKELKDSINVVLRDDIVIDVESLATKYPIVNWKTHARCPGSTQTGTRKNQQDYNLISWRLFDSCRIHMLLMHTGLVIHMMIEKKYPLTQEMLSRMLSRRLEVDEESEMAFELLRFIKSQLQN
ncbi:hypothetical protein Tco_0415197 [Tanacetum coccineum]